MRPSNLKEVASSVVSGMSRSINRSIQPVEEETREGSRTGSTLVDGKSPIEYIKMLADVQELPEKGELTESFDDESAEDYLREEAEATGQSYEEYVRSIAEEFEDGGHLGGRKGSRKGMDIDGYFNVVAGNHGLDIAKAIKVRDEMNEEGILPDTEEFVELSKKHGVDPDIMQNVVDDFAERYLM